MNFVPASSNSRDNCSTISEKCMKWQSSIVPNALHPFLNQAISRCTLTLYIMVKCNNYGGWEKIYNILVFTTQWVLHWQRYFTTYFSYSASKLIQAYTLHKYQHGLQKYQWWAKNCIISCFQKDKPIAIPRSLNMYELNYRKG